MGNRHQHSAGAGDWQGALRSEGYRLTPQRQLVLEAVQSLGHATPDEVLREVQERASGVNASTVYRTLDLLEKTGLVSHAHLGHGAPTYHPTTTPVHVHLVCRGCGWVGEADPGVADDLVATLDRAHGFETDLRHLTAFGRCASCRGGRGMTYRSPLLDVEGAVEAAGVDAGVAAHYGNPVAEQRRLESGEGWVDLSHRDVLSVAGPDRLTYLHAMTTQRFEGLAPGEPVDALVLSPQGHIEHAFTGADDGQLFLASTEPGHAAALAAFLDRMRFMLRVEISLLTGSHAVVAHGGLQQRILDRAGLESYAAQHGPPSGTWAYDALRIAAGRPRIGLDSDHRTIPNELGLLGRAVELDKGCYRGQETVARVHTLGRPPRRLVLLHLDGSVDRLPEQRADVIADGRSVGFVGSSARHHELGPIGLALVKRHVPLDVTLLTDGVAAAQEAIVDPEVGLHVRPVLR